MTKVKSYPKEKDLPKKKQKRQSTRDDKKVDIILHAISRDGLTIKKACALVEVPPGTFMEWIMADSVLAEQYEKHLLIRNETMAQEILDIADCTSEDDIFDENGNRKANSEWISRSRLRIDTRKWLLSKMLPKKYGDRVEVENGNSGVNVIVKNFVTRKTKIETEHDAESDSKDLDSKEE